MLTLTRVLRYVINEVHGSKFERLWVSFAYVGHECLYRGTIDHDVKVGFPTSSRVFFSLFSQPISKYFKSHLFFRRIYQRYIQSFVKKKKNSKQSNVYSNNQQEDSNEPRTSDRTNHPSYFKERGEKKSLSGLRLIYALAPIRQIKKRNLAPSPRKS